MSRVITFSRTFPSYHPKAGQPTYFVEKLLHWYWSNISDVYKGYDKWHDVLMALNHSKFSNEFYHNFCNELNADITEWKSHTIRGGHRFKVGDFFKPCVWTGKPYRSLQMQFLPALQIPKTWDFEIKEASKELPRDYDTDVIINHRFYQPVDETLKLLAQNDGLTLPELFQWFKYPKEFSGQIISWSDSIKY